MGKSSRVFITSSHRDRQWVREFAEELENEGVNVWLADKEIALGESLADKLEEGLRSSDSLVFVLSPENVGSSNMAFELGAALGMGKKVIAVVAKDVEAKDLPGPVRRRKYLLMESPQETARDVAKALTSVG